MKAKKNNFIYLDSVFTPNYLFKLKTTIMNNLKKLAVALLFFVAVPMSAQSTLEKWPAMKAFHEVMSRSFHPTEENNFEPLRAFSQTLADKAMELSTKEVPREIKTEQLMKTITRLQVKANEVNKLVKSNASNEALKKSITEAHDIYHEIVGMCTAEKKH